MPNIRIYTELDASQLENVDFRDVIETSAETLRWNDDNTKFIVKWLDGAKPRWLPRTATDKTRNGMVEEMDNQGNWSAL